MDFPRGSDSETHQTFPRASSDISSNQGHRPPANNPQVSKPMLMRLGGDISADQGARSLTSSNGTPNTSPANDILSTMPNRAPKSKPSPHSSTSTSPTKDLRIPSRVPPQDLRQAPPSASLRPNYINHTSPSPSYHTFVAWS